MRVFVLEFGTSKKYKVCGNVIEYRNGPNETHRIFTINGRDTVDIISGYPIINYGTAYELECRIIKWSLEIIKESKREFDEVEIKLY
jgi:hypothetical protein